MMHSISTEGIILNVSTLWADALGYTPAEMIGRPSVDFLTPASKRYAREKVLPEFWRNRRIHKVPYDFVRSDGSILPVRLSGIVVRTADGVRRSLAWVIPEEDGLQKAAIADLLASLLAEIQSAPVSQKTVTRIEETLKLLA